MVNRRKAPSTTPGRRSLKVLAMALVTVFFSSRPIEPRPVFFWKSA
ncbi:hypothetical protein [Rugamonas sp. DEMB1]|nr:hypothetical protein [Rugamonas sp. DEMB1]WGG51820.1 hypothetical protein QC826_06265 [Rugamonas sp. DEMB1]